MRGLSFLILVLFAVQVFAQSPHGSNLTYDCSDCHESISWKVNPASIKYAHDDNNFKLIGQHKQVQCISCHKPEYDEHKKIKALIFNKADDNCISCHKDIHQNTVGFDCSGCHTPESWIVKRINEIHQLSRFPLAGAHKTADCSECHKNFSILLFEPLSISCYSCHAADYLQTKSPDHKAAGFGTDCENCHNLTASQWSAGSFVHDFFPLTGGHNIKNCFSCHKQQVFTGLTKECISCHRIDYEAVKDPDHVKANFLLECTECHNTTAFIPASFDHSRTNFALTGAHAEISCFSCHSEQYTGTPAFCQSCHQQDYNTSINPSHTALQLPSDCQSCHTTNLDWQPARFDIHDQYYPLTGAHSLIKNNCATCHNGNYTTTANTCIGCHQDEYNATANPSHSAAHFPTECKECHSETAWKPSTFNHDGLYFPVYTGKHANKWSSCLDCHIDQNNFSVFSCITCHEHNKTETDNEHNEVSGYAYESSACYACHPKGEKEGAFNHASTGFPLSGGHSTAECLSCHSSGYSNTPTECVSCHQQDYNGSVNPGHTALQLPTDCNSCHTTNPDWQPASFEIHSQYYQLTGAHAAIKNDCSTCHKGNYTSTAKTCQGCHQADYNAAANPNHTALQLPSECQDCHTTTAWQPAEFDIHNQFYPLIGAHALIKNECVTCHNGNYSGTANTCIGCHQLDYNSSVNPNHLAAGFPTACDECHSQDVWRPSTFNHDAQYFPIYSGEHRGEWNICSDCHTNQSNFSVFSCTNCHEHNKQEMDDEHREVQGYVYNSVDCLNCHPNGKSKTVNKMLQR